MNIFMLSYGERQEKSKKTDRKRRNNDMAFKVTDMRKKLTVDLPNGIYCFYPDSGTGKTYLCNYLRGLPSDRYPVFAMTLNDFNLQKNIKIPLDRKLYVFDRYDMYNGKFIEEMTYLRDKAIVLVDVKSMIRGLRGFVGTCMMEFTSNEFKVN